MKTRKFVFAGLFALLLVLSGCNLPFSPSAEPSQNDQAATFVAQTLNATSPGEPVQATQTPRPANSPTQATSSGPTGTITPTYSIPMLKVDEPTNCRSGPGQNYEIITVF